METLLKTIIENVSNTRGQAFFNTITQALHQAVKADFTLVARIDRVNNCAHTLALAAGDSLVDNISYSLQGTPCANAADDSICCYPSDVCAAYPADTLLQEMKVQGYIGTPLHSLDGTVMGIIVAMYHQPIEDEQKTLALFKLFSGRIEAEMERVDQEEKALNAQQQLQKLIRERTAHLAQATEELKEIQHHLIESEKMAALGNLVAGLAHEVNTPLGVAITTQSLLEEQLENLARQFASQELSEQDLSDFLLLSREAMPLLRLNLERAVELVQSFRRTAADQHSSERSLLDIASYYQQALLTLKPLLKPVQAELELDIPEDWHLETIAGTHAQILTNLVSNSVQHGFNGPGPHRISIQGRRSPDGLYEIIYRDNGCGLTSESKKHLFEPFYTTARHKGGVGLGMSIVFNLVNQQLKGRVRLLDDAPGFGLSYSFADLAMTGEPERAVGT
ncbi:sensor histidine kinase [Shewanella cyperi]|uniref:sensor histidine kinase n=1 Tax=Shewanella cyperi TaxID=2814292 RepID=UPI001A94E18D|nr:ATP-binding protein [Shewanella cyperi]QSX42224.1 sensor histidine kinase [Shewanella cyperi]